MSFTRHVGEVGVEGTRIVRKGGIILFSGYKLQDKRLLPFIGDEVYCCDADDEIYINVVEYRIYRTTRRKIPKPQQGKLIAILGISDLKIRGEKGGINED